MDRQTLKSNARLVLAEHRWISVLVLLIYTAIISAAGPLSFIIAGPMAFGMISFFYFQSDDILEVFKGFKDFGKLLVTGLLLTLYQLLWTALFIIPGIIKGYAYKMTYYVLLENPELSANEAIAKSQELMMGHKWELFVLDLSFLGWDILSMLTCGILNFLYVGPYKQYAYSEFYKKIKGE